MLSFLNPSSFLTNLSWREVLLGYSCVEIGFYLLFKCYYVPLANRRRSPSGRKVWEYRDYGADRCHLTRRILDRLDQKAQRQQHQTHPRVLLEQFLTSWFCPITTTKTTTPNGSNNPKTTATATKPSTTLPKLHRLSQSSSDSDQQPEVLSSDTSDDDEQTNRFQPHASPLLNTNFDSNSDWSIPGLHQQDMDDFFAWAFFDKEFLDLADWERVELRTIFDELYQRYRLTFPPGYGGIYRARRLSLEDVQPLPRPLLIYAIVGTLETMGDLYLRYKGFRRFQSHNGRFVYWFRPEKNNGKSSNDKNSKKKKKLPLLFFHGIAPGGKMGYLPFCFHSVLASDDNDDDDDRAVFFFENHNISCNIRLDALTEAETVQGVEEAVRKHLDQNQSNSNSNSSNTPIALCGHSFGSCPLTWLLHSKTLRHRIAQFVLIDPVTILLSEPDVMVNFVYKRHESHNTGLDKIQLVAGTELFTEHYLRRCFAWYNSELWLDTDLPTGTMTTPQILVCLSGCDELVNAPSVKEEIESTTAAHTITTQTIRHHPPNTTNEKKHTSTITTTIIQPQQSQQRGQQLPQLDLIYWPSVGHAACVSTPHMWKDVRTAMRQQEARIVASLQPLESEEEPMDDNDDGDNDNNKKSN